MVVTAMAVYCKLLVYDCEVLNCLCYRCVYDVEEQKETTTRTHTDEVKMQSNHISVIYMQWMCVEYIHCIVREIFKNENFSKKRMGPNVNGKSKLKENNS